MHSPSAVKPPDVGSFRRTIANEPDVSPPSAFIKYPPKYSRSGAQRNHRQRKSIRSPGLRDMRSVSGRLGNKVCRSNGMPCSWSLSVDDTSVKGSTFGLMLRRHRAGNMLCTCSFSWHVIEQSSILRSRLADRPRCRSESDHTK